MDGDSHNGTAALLRLSCQSCNDVILPLEFKLDLYAMANAGAKYLSAYPVCSCGQFTTLWVQ